jgi:hypothetical protein
MEDFLKSQPDKEGKVSKLSLFDIGDESTGLSIAVPVHASLTGDTRTLNSDQGSMVMGISEYLKGKSGKPFFLVEALEPVSRFR